MDKKNDVPKEHFLAGIKIGTMWTLGSQYDHHVYLNVSFDLHGKYEVGRITTNTIMQMVNEFGFTMVKKRKYIHLEDPVLIPDGDMVLAVKYGLV